MLRALSFASLLHAALGATTIVDSAANNNGYCYGYYDQTDHKKWCWLTEDGVKKHAIQGKPYSCRSFDSYNVNDYCENGKTHRHTHTSKSKIVPGVDTIVDASANSNGYCYGYFDSTNKKKWCYLADDGLQKYTKQGKPWQCRDFNGHNVNNWCENGKSAAGPNVKTSVHKPAAKTGLVKILQESVGQTQINCKAVCWYFSQSSWSRRSSWSGSTTDTTCTCGTKKTVKIRCTGKPFDKCTVTSALGSAKAPKVGSVTGSGASAKTAAGHSLGKFIADWAKAQVGRKIGSDATSHRQTECWDLAMAAIEKAKAEGFSIANPPGSYKWSTQTVNYKKAQPGDIAQFKYWSEKITYPGGGWSTRSTGPVHTAVVTKAFDSGTCGIETYDQNPSPVSKSVYHPCFKNSGSASLIFYRLTHSSRLSSDDGPWPVPEEFQNKAGEMGWSLWAACGFAAVSMAALSFRMFRARAARDHGMLLSTEDPETELATDVEGLDE